MEIHGRSKLRGTTVGLALPSGSDGMQRLSIVLPNYNYGAFIGEAVESALAVDWPDVEVIVVDDGSTDNSLEVLAGFGSRITVITQENSGPRVACNRGFAASNGYVVIFLDSDDVLAPSIPSWPSAHRAPRRRCTGWPSRRGASPRCWLPPRWPGDWSRGDSPRNVPPMTDN